MKKLRLTKDDITLMHKLTRQGLTDVLSALQKNKSLIIVDEDDEKTKPKPTGKRRNKDKTQT